MFQKEGPSLWELTQQALSGTTKGYDMLAPKFEQTPFRTPDVLIGPMMNSIGPAGSIGSALDICCGTGAVLQSLRPKCTDHVTGVDLSQGMLDQARINVEAAPGEARVDLFQRDAMNLDFHEEFDIVTCCGAFGHILEPDQDRFADGVRRALKPGGRFLFITRPMPAVTDAVWWKARGFNAVMHVRNAVKSPPFIMFYLTFTLERARDVLHRHGFEIQAHAPYQGLHKDFWLVSATKR